jgi:hypothetical protein
MLFDEVFNRKRDCVPGGAQSSLTWGIIETHVGNNRDPRGRQSCPTWETIMTQAGRNENPGGKQHEKQTFKGIKTGFHGIKGYVKGYVK